MVSTGCKGHTGKQMSKIGVDTCRLEIINTNEKEIRQYYANWCDVGLDGIAVMPIEQQEKYTDVAIELLRDALSKAGYKPVTSQKAAAAIRKYFNVDIFKVLPNLLGRVNNFISDLSFIIFSIHLVLSI